MSQNYRSLLLMPVVVSFLCGLVASANTSWADAPVADEALAVGSKVDDFELPLVSGEGQMKLSEQYAKGPVAVVILRGYPGYQCPLCSRQVSALVNRAKALAKDSSRIILVYPGEPDLLQEHAEEFMGQRTLPEPLVLVRDPGMKMVDAWGLRWNAPRETAYPTTVVIDQRGLVTWKKVSDNHGGRTTADEVLGELRKAAKAK